MNSEKKKTIGEDSLPSETLRDYMNRKLVEALFCFDDDDKEE